MDTLPFPLIPWGGMGGIPSLSPAPVKAPVWHEKVFDVKSIYRAHKMACRCLVGLEKGNCAFLGCFLMSAAGGFGCVHIHARARVRASARRLFRKQNKVGSGFSICWQV